MIRKTRKRFRIARAGTTLLYALLLVFGILRKDYLTLAVLMGVSLIAGAYYCGWLCPFGAVQEWLGRLGRLLKLPRLRIPRKIETYLRFTRYLLLALSFTGIMFLYFLDSPYSTFMGVLSGNTGLIAPAAWILFGVFLSASLVIDRPFCRYLCAEGARYGALSLGRLFSFRRNAEKCVNCGACDKACPVQIEVSKKQHVRNAQCVNCFECTAACPVDGALKYGWALGGQKGPKDSTRKETT